MLARAVGEALYRAPSPLRLSGDDSLKPVEQAAEALYRAPVEQAAEALCRSPVEQAAEALYRAPVEQAAEAAVKLLTPAATAEAVAELYRRAAVQGHPSGQLALGRCYLSGEGVQRCDRRAREWLERAAAQGADENVAAAWATDELAALTRDAEPVK
jgi:TPR repeat protein